MHIVSLLKSAANRLKGRSPDLVGCYVEIVEALKMLEDNSVYKLTLVRYTDSMIPLLKILRDRFGLDLTQSKTVLKSLPHTFKEEFNPEMKSKLVIEFESAGGIVESTFIEKQLETTIQEV